MRGQGQEKPFRGQTLSRPRTKDTSASALKTKKKKNGLHKNFSSYLHKKSFPNNFSSAPQTFNNSKNSAVLEPRTGQFSRTWGLGAKAKDLTFEAIAKDFKMRPRGQGRPRGLHLWYTISIVLNYTKTIYARRRIATPQIDVKDAIDRGTKITRQNVFYIYIARGKPSTKRICYAIYKSYRSFNIIIVFM